MTHSTVHEPELPHADLGRLSACAQDRQALMLYAEELVARIAEEVDQYHDTIEAEINETANQIALAVDDNDDAYYEGLVRHVATLQADRFCFSVTSRPSYKLHEQVLQQIRDLDQRTSRSVH